MLKVICLKSKKSDFLYYALINCTTDKEIFCTIDVDTICKITGLTKRDVYLLAEGEYILFSIERS